MRAPVTHQMPADDARRRSRRLDLREGQRGKAVVLRWSLTTGDPMPASTGIVPRLVPTASAKAVIG